MSVLCHYPLKLRETIETLEKRGIHLDWGYYVHLYRVSFYNRFNGGQLDTDESAIDYVSRRLLEEDLEDDQR